MAMGTGMRTENLVGTRSRMRGHEQRKQEEADHHLSAVLGQHLEALRVM